MGTQSLDRLVLGAVEERGSIETFEFAKECGKDHQSIVGSIKSIHALGDVSLEFFSEQIACRCRSFTSKNFPFVWRFRVNEIFFIKL